MSPNRIVIYLVPRSLVSEGIKKNKYCVLIRSYFRRNKGFISFLLVSLSRIINHSGEVNRV